MGVTTPTQLLKARPRVTVHRNAKTTPHMRALLVSRIQVEHWSPVAAAAAAGISVRTAYKWLARYRFGGRAALVDRSSTPHNQPRRTPPEVVARIVAARYDRRTAWQIAVQQQVPRSTVAVILRRVGLNRLARLTPPPPVVRYERARPGELTLPHTWLHTSWMLMPMRSGFRSPLRASLRKKAGMSRWMGLIQSVGSSP